MVETDGGRRESDEIEKEHHLTVYRCVRVTRNQEGGQRCADHGHVEQRGREAHPPPVVGTPDQQEHQYADRSGE